MQFQSIDVNIVKKEIEYYKSQDIPWENVFNSICSKPLQIGIDTFTDSIDTNLGDPRIFKGTYKLEAKVISMLGKLFHNKECFGNFVSGGTEANLLALLNAKYRKEILSPEIILPTTAHFSFNKIIRLLNLTPKYVDVDKNFKAIPSQYKQHINNNTIALVATAGTSEFGSIDPIEEISQIALKNDLYFHVDAATGGFIIPFAEKLGYNIPSFDFSLSGVSSITVDPHKYGLAPIPAGIILFKDYDSSSRLNTESFFNATPSHQTFIGTRPGAAVTAIYSIIKSLGIKGFMDITQKNFSLTKYLTEKLKENNFTLICQPELNIVNFLVKDANYLMSKFEDMGVILSSSKRISNVIRIVINNHTTYESIDNLINILNQLEYNN